MSKCSTVTVSVVLVAAKRKVLVPHPGPLSVVRVRDKLCVPYDVRTRSVHRSLLPLFFSSMAEQRTSLVR
jgi:hypothetical protein